MVTEELWIFQTNTHRVGYDRLVIKLNSQVSIKKVDDVWLLDGKPVEFSTDITLSNLLDKVDPYETTLSEKVGGIVANATAVAVLFSSGVITLDDFQGAFDADGNGGEGIFMCITFRRTDFFLEIRPNEFFARFGLKTPKGSPVIVLVDHEGILLQK